MPAAKVAPVEEMVTVLPGQAANVAGVEPADGKPAQFAGGILTLIPITFSTLPALAKVMLSIGLEKFAAVNDSSY